MSRQSVKETIGVGVNEKAALSSDKNCPDVYKRQTIIGLAEFE